MITFCQNGSELFWEYGSDIFCVLWVCSKSVRQDFSPSNRPYAHTRTWHLTSSLVNLYATNFTWKWLWMVIIHSYERGQKIPYDDDKIFDRNNSYKMCDELRIFPHHSSKRKKERKRKRNNNMFIRCCKWHYFCMQMEDGPYLKLIFRDHDDIAASSFLWSKLCYSVFQFFIMNTLIRLGVDPN